MPDPSPNYLLKVLNGSQFGAEMGITAGSEWTLGSGDDNRIVLTDSNVAEHHAKLFFDQQGRLFIEALEGGISIDGKPLTTPRSEVTPFQVVTLGSTHLTIGPVGEVWPAIRLPRMHQIGLAPAKPPKPPEEKPKKRPLLSRPPVLAAAAVLGLLLSCAAIWLVFTPSARDLILQSPGTPPEGDPLDSEQISIEELAMKRLKEQVPDALVRLGYEQGRPNLTIYVQSRALSDQVHRVMNVLPEPIYFTTIVRDDLAKSLEVLLEANQIKTVTYEIKAPASVTWTGFLLRKAEWDRLLKMVENDIAAITENIAEITFGDDLADKVSRFLAKKGLADKITASLTDQGVLLSGTIPEADLGQWASTVKDLETMMGGHTPIIDQVDGLSPAVEVSSPSLRLDSPIVGVNLAGMPYISLANGSKLYPGARLSNGAVLEQILPTRIIFSGPQGSEEVMLNLSTGFGGISRNE